ncbi:hypothetical protein HZA57_07085 [Candidatus Poribacteria bacterium]|nr:hypothetical protein [Candidatus Poribacteria bacterium]
MSDVFHVSWWFSFLGQWLPWWLLCVVISCAALPLVLNVFRGLADRGAGLAAGAGIALSTFITWGLTLEWFSGRHPAGVIRALLFLLGAAIVAAGAWPAFRPSSAGGRKPFRRAAPGVAAGLLLAILGLVHLPFGGFAVWAAILLLAGCSAVVLWSDPKATVRAIRQTAVPFLASQALFLLAFVFFLNVRSYIPYATYDTGMWGAEKFGNLTHLNSVMRSDSMPPIDAWFISQPTNYYYGGHLTVAVLAKAIVKPARTAFNLGLATVFGLTFAMGFSFVFNLVHAFPRRWKAGRWSRTKLLSGVLWHRGMGWGVLGAFAIAFFGNLDAWQQLATRDPQGVRWDVENRLAGAGSTAGGELADTTSLSNEEIYAVVERRYAEEGRERAELERLLEEDASALEQPDPGIVEKHRQRLAEISSLVRAAVRDLREGRSQPLTEDERRVVAQLRMNQPGYLRFSPENLAVIDFWRSSRAYKSSPPGDPTVGTITEFPYFSAILGDLHPHHMAIPYSLLILCATLSLLRKSSRMVPTDCAWFRRNAVDLIAMGVAIGMVFPVNIWDAVVMAPMLGVALIVSLKGVACGRHWRWIAWAGMMVLVILVVSLIWNSQNGAVLLFARFKAVILGVAAIVAGHFAVDRFQKLAPARMGILASVWVIGVGLTFVSGYSHGARARGEWELTYIEAKRAAELAASDPQSANAPEGEQPGYAIAQIEARKPAPPFHAGGRDAIIFLLIAAGAASWALWSNTPLKNWWTAAGSAYAACGGIALFTILPFKAFFQSPLYQARPLFTSLMPPRLDGSLFQTAGRFWDEFMSRSPVNGFQAELRTDLRDVLVHWGLFLVPILVLWIARSVQLSLRWKEGRSFAFWMSLLAIFFFALNYMTKWAGPLALSLTAASLVLALVRRRDADSPLWVFMTAAFFFLWFVEALHFDDNYTGVYERYNTPFKILYPLWPIMAGGMTVALHGLARRLRPREPFHAATYLEILAEPSWIAALGVGCFAVLPLVAKLGFPLLTAAWGAVMALVLAAVVAALALPFLRGRGLDASRCIIGAIRCGVHQSPAWLLVAVVLVAGLLYPYSATASRTRSFFHKPLESYISEGPEIKTYTERTLDALAYLANKPDRAEDFAAIEWLLANVKERAVILEAPGEHGYSADGRIATTTGLRTLLGWSHHERQWRGYDKPVDRKLAARFAPFFEFHELRLQDIAAAYVPANLPEDQKARLKQLAAGPRENLPANLAEALPDLAEVNQFRIAERILREDAGTLTVMQIVDKVLQHGKAIYEAPSFDDRTRELIRFYQIDYVIVGSLERTMTTAAPLRKFNAWEKVFEQGSTAIYKVPADLRGGEGIGG